MDAATIIPMLLYGAVTLFIAAGLSSNDDDDDGRGGGNGATNITVIDVRGCRQLQRGW